MVEHTPVDPELTIICPMYNEALGIEGNIDSLLSTFETFPFDWELILVNDGSTDNTLELARRKVGDDPRIQIISYDKNRGRGYALRQGFAGARGRFIITTESDLSWGANIVDVLYKALVNEESDVVIASPHREGGRLENVPFKRRILSSFGNKILKLAVSMEVTMLSGMTRGYRREVIRELDLESDGKEIHLEILSKVEAAGFTVSEVPAVLRWESPKPGKAKRKSSFRAGRYIYSHLLFSFNQRPYLLLGSIGAFMMLIGIGMGLYLFQLSAIQHIKVAGRPMIQVTALSILGGFLIVILCFLANQIRDVRRSVMRLGGLIKRLETEATHKNIEQTPGDSASIRTSIRDQP
jgi:glycosyltransferase involved in cell wall biosynthesis